MACPRYSRRRNGSEADEESSADDDQESAPGEEVPPVVEVGYKGHLAVLKFEAELFQAVDGCRRNVGVVAGRRKK